MMPHARIIGSRRSGFWIQVIRPDEGGALFALGAERATRLVLRLQALSPRSLPDVSHGLKGLLLRQGENSSFASSRAAVAALFRSSLFALSSSL
jgi:hypothetical protein